MGDDPYARPAAHRQGDVDDHPAGNHQSVSGPAASPPPPVSTEQAARAGVLVRRFALLTLAGLICLQLDFPWRAAGLPFTVAGIVVGVMALIAVRRARIPGSSTAMCVVGLVLSAMMLIFHLTLLALYPLVSDNEECLAGANTERARTVCQQDYERRVDDLRRLGSAAQPPRP